MTAQADGTPGVNGAGDQRNPLTPEPYPEQVRPFQPRETGRVSAFSDGIFAIALTLPVLEFKLPDDGQAVGPYLLGEWPALLAFVVTFAVGSNLWLSHYRLLDAVTHLDERVLKRNIVFLFVFSLLPFSTALVMHQGEQTAAVVVYALNVAALYLALSRVSDGVLADGEVRSEGVAGVRLARANTHALGGLFVLEALVACGSPTLALCTPVLIPLVLRVVRRIMIPRLFYKEIGDAGALQELTS